MTHYLSKTKLLITGGNGQLASALAQAAAGQAVELIICPHSELDITNAAAVQQVLNTVAPTWVINTAAYTAVDKAEQEPELAMQVNHLGAKILAQGCAQVRVPLLHISTDYIFDGANTTPYLVDAKSHPINVYGQAKWLGEEAIREYCEQHFILRVSGVFSEFGHNFFKTILRLAREKHELRIVADQITCPTYAGHIAKVIYSLVTRQVQWGTYHYCDRDAVSWHEFAAAIVQALQQQESIIAKSVHAITTAEYPTAAKRPRYSVLDCHKLLQDYGIKQMHWRDGIQQALQHFELMQLKG